MNGFFKTKLCILKEQGIISFLVHIFIMAKTKWKLNIIVDRLTYEKLLPSSGKQFLRSPETMNGINIFVSKCNFFDSFIITVVLCCIIWTNPSTHGERMTIF